MKQLCVVVILAAAGVFAGIASNTQPAHAFGDWFRRDDTCGPPYKPRVRYRTVRKHVVKRPGIYVIRRRPGLYGWRKIRVRDRRGRLVWRKKRVLIRPYENVARYYKPRQRWVYKRQRIIVAAPPRPRGAWPDSC